jgi:hypothetical protein
MYADPCLRLSECDLTRRIGSTRALENPRLHVYTNYLYVRAMRSQAKTVSDTLFKMAEGQQGYLTARQAADATYQLGSQAHHVKSGMFKREAVLNWLQSGKSAAVIAQEPGLHASRLYAWKHCFAPADAGGKAAGGKAWIARRSAKATGCGPAQDSPLARAA